MSDAIKAEIHKLEDCRYQALIDSDFGTLDRLLGDGLIYTHSSGQSDTRAEYIGLCKKGVFQYRAIERPIENIQVYGTTVVVTGHAKMDVIIEGNAKLLNSRYTNVWSTARRAGRWWHGSPRKSKLPSREGLPSRHRVVIFLVLNGPRVGLSEGTVPDRLLSWHAVLHIGSPLGYLDAPVTVPVARRHRRFRSGSMISCNGRREGERSATAARLEVCVNVARTPGRPV